MNALPAFLRGLRPTLHISHRGGASLAPENTMEAFRQAVERFHTDMLELDVHVTRDGEVIVAHDDTLERCTDGFGPLAGQTLSELKKLDAGYGFTPDEGRTFPFRGQGVRIPTLREVLRAFPALRLNVELKPDVPGHEEVFARLLEDEGAVERVCMGSEQDAVGERLVARLPHACHFYPRDALAALVIALRGGEPPPEDPRFTVLDMPLYFGEVRLVDADFLRDCAARGKWVNVWTVDDPDEMQRLLEEGVGGIMTDRPDLLRQRMDDLTKPG
ncbi:glycerophosphodiester phosphodiesterase [Myxococcus sp. CA051A]|uniref:glycerophosphodiester phosphodiesterase n=1 Tax=unclassified Myxococcus TaxID=2648731 RepID=UPI00157B1947|nr:MULTISPECIES: glycerophosphodiester phosphodiesterase [unclassified Myxococcus]NTX13259.1 glycerophosphodiester phosphodiesterase [Myxococcus sp. CA056]NTX36289.1 glycerophosphodiester phosphodiesterase [Myxococcus sp. CA033]NTX61719.1 glycerophosphodiester phosphodiesterase [Myxococcus sp. CA051A]